MSDDKGNSNSQVIYPAFCVKEFAGIATVGNENSDAPSNISTFRDSASTTPPPDRSSSAVKAPQPRKSFSDLLRCLHTPTAAPGPEGGCLFIYCYRVPDGYLTSSLTALPPLTFITIVPLTGSLIRWP